MTFDDWWKQHKTDNLRDEPKDSYRVIWHAAVAAERERCAKLCDAEFPRLPSNAERDLCVWIAQGIRKGWNR